MYYPFSPSPPSTSYTLSSAMDIPSSRSSHFTTPSTTTSCAYPSWPRRSSLSSSPSSPTSSSEDAYYTSSSFIISDEELFAEVFDSESEYTPSSTPHSHTSRSPASPSVFLDMVVENGSLVRRMMAEEKAKKERKVRAANAGRKSAKKGKRSGSSESRRSSQGQHMSPILEVGE